MLFFENLYEPNEQFVERLSLYERKQILLLNNLTTESTMYALKMLNRRTCMSNQDGKQRLEELSFNESGKSERSRTKSNLTSKYGVTRLWKAKWCKIQEAELSSYSTNFLSRSREISIKLTKNQVTFNGFSFKVTAYFNQAQQQKLTHSTNFNSTPREYCVKLKK